MTNKEYICDKLPDPLSTHHPHARRVGEFIYVSGLIARQTNGMQIPGVTLSDKGEVIDYDIEHQTRAVFENLKLVLSTAGSSLSHVIDITVFLTNIRKDFERFNSIYGEYFSNIRPCRTTIEVSRFPSPVQIEVKCIAIVSTSDAIPDS